MTESVKPAEAPAEKSAPKAPPPKSFASIVWAQFSRNRVAMGGLFLVGVFFLLAFFAPFLGHNLPLVWFDGDGGVSYPLVREFFAPQETTEQMLDMSFNFLLLFLPLATILLYGIKKLAPGISRVNETWVAQLIGGVMSLVIVGVLFYKLMPCGFELQEQETLGYWYKEVSAYFVAKPSLGWTRVAGFLLASLIFVGFITIAANNMQACLKWVFVLALALGLALPFILTKRVKEPDPARFRIAAEAGRGHGVFSVAPYGPTEQGFGKLLPPTWFAPDKKTSDNKPGYHLLGTDVLGRDILVRMIHGARVSLSVGFVTVAIYSLLGIILGSCAAYFGSWIDILISRAIEIMMCFPTFFLILAIVAIIDERSIFNIMLVLGLTGWTGVARLIRGEVLKQKKLDYVASAQALGASDSRVMFRHILPNAIAPVLVSITFGIAGAILTEAGLSFLGFGVMQPTPTWGTLLNKAREQGISTYWWLAVFPGMLIFLSVTAYNLVGEGLRDAMDPRLKK